MRHGPRRESEFCIIWARSRSARPLKHAIMSRVPPVRIRHSIAVALCAVIALAVPAAGEAGTVRADLDGDGVHDRVEASRAAGVLTLRLTGTRRSLLLRANDFIVKFIVADIDHDGDADVVAQTRESGLRFWINKGRGRFAFRLPQRARPLRAHHVKPVVRGIQGLREEDSALNDTSRLLVDVPSLAGQRLVATTDIPPAENAPLSRFTHRSRPPRGPPSILSL